MNDNDIQVKAAEVYLNNKFYGISTIRYDFKKTYNYLSLLFSKMKERHDSVRGVTNEKDIRGIDFTCN